MTVKISFRLALLLLISAGVSSAKSQTAPAGFTKIFDGKTMKGWDADPAFWRVENGTFVGEVKPGQEIKTNTFLIWTAGTPANFELKAQYRISPEGNSGIQYRSAAVKGVSHGLKGYQADIDGANTYTGQNYEERGRGFLAMRGEKALLKTGQKPLIKGSVGNSDSLKNLIKTNDWNDIHIIANGNHLRHYINGVLMSDATDEDTKERKFKGLLGFQVHVMPFMKVEYRNIYIKNLK